jgi:hypothetical protein
MKICRKTVTTLAVLFTFLKFCYAQEPDHPYPDLPVPGMYELLQKMKVKEVDLWSCLDSSCETKEQTSFMIFDSQGRIDKEIDIDEGKNVPYQIFNYPSKNEIIKKYNAEDYWITHRYLFNDNGRMEKQFIQATNLYDIEDTYYYEDTLLLKEELVDRTAQAFYDTVTYTYEYDSAKRLIKKYNNSGDRIEEFEYDSSDKLARHTMETKDAGLQKKITMFFYSKNNLTRKKEEWYDNGAKVPSKKKETNYVYDSNGLLSQEFYYTGKANNKKITILYTYIF